MKGIIYGLFLYFIIIIRIEMYVLPYGDILDVAGDLFSFIFHYILYGLLLGSLYEFLKKIYCPIKEEPKIVTPDMKSGLLPGAIAGFCGGIAAGFFAVLGHVTGYWGVVYEKGGEIMSTITFWASQFGTHVLINMISGVIFGLLFPLVYNLVPGEKVRKGLYYGLIMYLITSFQLTMWVTSWLANHGYWSLILSQFLSLSISASNMIIFGLVLGYLYRKPSE